jgi:hypothetical protein
LGRFHRARGRFPSSQDLLSKRPRYLPSYATLLHHLGVQSLREALEQAALELGVELPPPADHLTVEARQERNREIVRLHREEGLTLEAIGERVQLTRERVRQLLRMAEVPPEETARIRQERTRQDWRCAVCGKEEKRTQAQASARTCGSETCRREFWDEEASTGPRPACSPSHGRWTVRDPRTGKTMRLERHLAQERLGRVLSPLEWVVLKDGDPRNLAPENIEVLTPREVMARRRSRRTWTQGSVLEALRAFHEKYGGLPSRGLCASERAEDADLLLPRPEIIQRHLGVRTWAEAMRIVAGELGISPPLPARRGARAITQDEAIQALRRFVEERGRLPEPAEMPACVRPRYLPSRPALLRALEASGWSEGMRRAAQELGIDAPVPPGGARRRTRRPTHTPESVRAALDRFQAEHGRVPTPRELRIGKRPSYLPSHMTIAKNLGADWRERLAPAARET